MIDTLKEYVQLVIEAAVDAKSAATFGFALYKRARGNYVNYILYDPKTFKTCAKFFNDDEFYSNFAPKVIVGYVSTEIAQNKCNNATEIAASAARQGFGPLMYDIAMSDNVNGIYADRGGTSNAAQQVWKHYLLNRGDVEIAPFDNEDEPKTPPPEDDCQFVDNKTLDQSFKMKKRASSLTTRLLNKHENLMKKMTQLGPPTRVFLEEKLFELADDYFFTRYNNG